MLHHFLRTTGVKKLAYWISAFPHSSSTAFSNYGVTETTAGDIILATGYGSSPPLLLSKFDSDGKLTKQVIPADNIALLSSDISKCTGGILTASSSTTGAFGRLLKVDSSTLLPTATYYTGEHATFYYSVIIGARESPNGNIIVAQRYNNQARILSLNSTLSTVNWAKSYSQPAACTVIDMVVNSDDTIYALFTFTESTQTKYMLSKIDSSGNLLWSRSIASASGNLQVSGQRRICTDASLNVYVSGLAVSGTRQFILKYDPSGTVQWQRYITVANTDSTTGSVMYMDGYVYVAFLENTTRFSVVKYNLSGVVQWQRYLSHGSNNISSQGTGIAISPTSDNSAFLLTFCAVYGSNQQLTGGVNVLARLPADGTGTGTYLPFTYAVGSLVEGSGSLTLASVTASAANVTHYVAAASNSSIVVPVSYNVS